MALSIVVSEILIVEKCHDLDIRIRGHSRSLKVYRSIDCLRFPKIWNGTMFGDLD